MGGVFNLSFLGHGLRELPLILIVCFGFAKFRNSDPTKRVYRSVGEPVSDHSLVLRICLVPFRQGSYV